MAAPPLETRFRPGQSGNPRGRSRKRPPEDPALASLDPLLAASLRVMSEPVPVSVGGRVRSVSGEEAVVRAVLDRALMGDNRSTRLLLDLRAQGQARLEQVRAQSLGLGDDATEAVMLVGRLMREVKRQGGTDLSVLATLLEVFGLEAAPSTAQSDLEGGTLPEERAIPSQSAAVMRADEDAVQRLVADHDGPSEAQQPRASLPISPLRGEPGKTFDDGGRGEPLVRSCQPLAGSGYGLGGKLQAAPACGLFD